MLIGFHSYKGGVGRTKLMVGAGALLALNGHRVGMLDFDLDASGLATMFGADRKSVGARELLHILQHANHHLALDAIIDISMIVRDRFDKDLHGNGCLKYIPTISDPELADSVRFDGPMRYAVQALFEFTLKECGVDILLIDLKPGFSPASALVFPLIDRAVVVTRLDSQNIDGLSHTLPRLKKANLETVLVVNFLPEGLQEQVTKRLQRLEKATGQRVSVSIKYDPTQVFDDDFVAAADRNSSIHRGLHDLIAKLDLS